MSRSLTPAEIVAELDRYIVGQDAAKRAVAIALRNRYRRQKLSPEDRQEVLPKNILMIGPTGVGKTEIARRLARLAHAPFIKVEATKFTEVGYVGRDVESMIRELVAASIRLVEEERFAEVRETAEAQALERLAELLDERPARFPLFSPEDEEEDGVEEEEDRALEREKLIAEIKRGEHDDKLVRVEVEEAASPFVQVFSAQGVEEMGLDMPGGPFGGSRRVSRKARVSEAKAILLEDESRQLVDSASIRREAIDRAEQSGIIFLDEIDKVAIKSGSGGGPDVSREGVQRDLLPIIEGSTVQTKFGPVRTDHILFIAAGAFHMAKPSDLIPELQGRLPIRVELTPLAEEEFRRILSEPKNALTKQYEKLLAVEGVELSFTSDAVAELARYAQEANRKMQNIGARRLHTLLERVLEEISFDATERRGEKIAIDGEYVRARLQPLLDEPQRL